MSGRAGRLKQHDLGRSIMFADTPAEESILWRNYIEGAFSASAILAGGEFPGAETLFLLAAGICASGQDVQEFMRQSYAGILHWQNSPKLLNRSVRKSGRLSNGVLTHGLLIATETNRLQVTEIGRVCAMQGVAVETFIRVMGFLENIDLADCAPWDYCLQCSITANSTICTCACRRPLTRPENTGGHCANSRRPIMNPWCSTRNTCCKTGLKSRNALKCRCCCWIGFPG